MCEFEDVALQTTSHLSTVRVNAYFLNATLTFHVRRLVQSMKAWILNAEVIGWWFRPRLL